MSIQAVTASIDHARTRELGSPLTFRLVYDGRSRRPSDIRSHQPISIYSTLRVCNTSVHDPTHMR